MYVCMYMYVYTYIYIYIHTNAHKIQRTGDKMKVVPFSQ